VSAVVVVAFASSSALPRGGKVVAKVPIPAGTGGFAVGEGAVWAVSDRVLTLTRIDPARNAAVASIKFKLSNACSGEPPGCGEAAAGNGAVIFAGRDPGYGGVVIVAHGGQLDTLYGHLSALYVREGQSVRRGQAIGAVGATGRATGAHLHYEVRVNGAPVDPRRYLAK